MRLLSGLLLLVIPLQEVPAQQTVRVNKCCPLGQIFKSSEKSCVQSSGIRLRLAESFRSSPRLGCSGKKFLWQPWWSETKGNPVENVIFNAKILSHFRNLLSLKDPLTITVSLITYMSIICSFDPLPPICPLSTDTPINHLYDH